MSKLSIIIPVFNEERTVHELLTAVANQPLPEGVHKEMVIIESNSNDNTRKIVRAFADQMQTQRSPAATANGGVEVRLIFEDRPQGKGHAVRAGLAQATGDIILIQDGDLEYDVRDYPALLAPILSGQAEFVLGSRHLAVNSWKIRKFETQLVRGMVMNFGGWLFHTFFNWLYGTRLTDPTTMYKVFKRHLLNRFTLESNRFDFDFELVGKLCRSGAIPVEVPISYVSRGFDEGKKVRMFGDPLTWVRAIVKYRFVPLRKNAAAQNSADAEHQQHPVSSTTTS